MKLDLDGGTFGLHSQKLIHAFGELWQCLLGIGRHRRGIHTLNTIYSSPVNDETMSVRQKKLEMVQICFCRHMHYGFLGELLFCNLLPSLCSNPDIICSLRLTSDAKEGTVGVIGQLLLGFVCSVYTMQQLLGQKFATKLGTFSNSIVINPAAIRCLLSSHNRKVEGERSSYMNGFTVRLRWMKNSLPMLCSI